MCQHQSLQCYKNYFLSNTGNQILKQINSGPYIANGPKMRSLGDMVRLFMKQPSLTTFNIVIKYCYSAKSDCLLVPSSLAKLAKSDCLLVPSSLAKLLGKLG